MNRINVRVKEEKHSLGDMFGIFFEDINHAADGGLYPELVRNRSFEFDKIDNGSYDHLTSWEKVEKDGKVELTILDKGAFCEVNPHYLQVEVLEEGKCAGFKNLGFKPGMAVEQGKTYRFTAYMKRDTDLDKTVKAAIVSEDGKEYASVETTVTDEWKKYEFVLAPSETDCKAQLMITINGGGKAYFDFISLYPTDTYKGRKNGLRKDIAEMLEDLHAKFLRFPGGCLVHDGSLNPDDRNSMYRWKNTIGDVERRPARRNNWGYNQTLGLGFYEYFLLCEDIGAKALPVVPGGCDPHHHRYVPMDELQPWIDDALDLIEFANGSVDTEWGAKRAEMGHPEPFNLEYIAIGNEEVSAPFYERYPLFVETIKKKYPDIKVIGSASPFACGGEYERGWASARSTDTDLVDEHYYMSPEWFLANNHRYDNFKENEPKVFLGEYASWGNTWYNALVEASFMAGLQNNAHAVGLACYAPLLCNVNYINWQPDMIWFDNHKVYGTANYYVQKLFMNYQGDKLIQTDTSFDCENEIVSQFPEHIPGKILVSAKDVEVRYTDIKIKNTDTGALITYPDVYLNRGDKDVEIGDVDWKCYTVEMKAEELDGHRGFFMEFGRLDEKNNNTWEIGGWQNLDHAVCRNINGRNSCLEQYEISIDKNRVYDLKLEVEGRHIRTYVDGVKVHDIEDKPTVIEPLYVSSSKTSDEIIIKVVNVSDKVKSTVISLDGMDLSGKAKCRMITMKGFGLEDKNDFENPMKVSPRVTEFDIYAPEFSVDIDKEAIYVFVVEGR